MDDIASQHLFLLRMSPEAATKYHQGIVNLFELAEKKSDGGRAGRN